MKHHIQPYIRYIQHTKPSVKPADHYIFDIQDGLYRTNIVRFGLRNFLYTKNARVLRKFSMDLYANAFIHNRGIHDRIPRLYYHLIWNHRPNISYILQTGWDISRHRFDHLNLRNEWTVNENLAFALEFRHRSAYSWRKVDKDNFMLDFEKDEKELRESAISDRRNTFLAHCFLRFTENNSLELRTRQGWKRRHQHRYSEYEVTFMTLLRETIACRFSYQFREDDHRFSIGVTYGEKKDVTFVEPRWIGEGNYQ